MGWLVSYERLRHGQTPDDYLRETWRTAEGRTIIDSATVGNTWYAALKIDRDGEAPQVACLVYLFSRGSGRNGDGFGYKSMDETMGPCEIDCPKRILDLLTPTDSDYANQWRAACAAKRATKAAERKSVVKIAPGMTVRLARPIRFRSGFEADTFTIVPNPPRTRGIIATHAKTGSLYRLNAADVATAEVVS